MLCDVQRQTDKYVQHKEDDEGCTILIERWHIGFLYRFGFGYRQCDRIRYDGRAVTPAGVPFLQKDRVGRRAYPRPLPVGKGDFCRAVGI